MIFFDSIGLQKGVVFHLYNKELIDQLHINQNQPLFANAFGIQIKPLICNRPLVMGV